MTVTVPLPSVYEFLGSVEGLQVQLRPLKDGPPGQRRYDPTPLLPVPALLAGAAGCLGLPTDGDAVTDVHHRDHPTSRDPKGRAGLTVMAVADYERLRRDYGGHVVNGSAGETMLLATEGELQGRDLSAGLLVDAETPDGEPLRLPLEQLRPAAPCVEFSRWCLGCPPTRPWTRPYGRRWSTSTTARGASGRSPLPPRASVPS
jgi:hypothetical protein